MSTLHIEQIDDNHFRELFATRTELHADPPQVAGEISTTGRVVFWTEWLLYSYGNLLTRMEGPRIEHSFSTLIARTWDVPLPDGSSFPLPTTLLMGGIKVAFITLVNEQFAPTPMPPPLPEEPEEPEPEEPSNE